MAFTRVSKILQMADKAKTSVIAFNCINYDTIYSAITVAEEQKKPVICMLYPEHASINNVCTLAGFATMVESLANKVRVPVGLHLDHSSDYAFIIEAIQAGFTSVMYDGSMLSLEDNLRNSQKVVETAHLLGADVEAELGHVGLVSDAEDDIRNAYTQADRAAYFARESGVDSLAIAIGSAHGEYKSTPKLALDLLDEINAQTPVPLVLHGGSGIPDDQLNEAFKRGINKFNVGTEYLKLWNDSMTNYTQEPGLIPQEVPAKVQGELMNYMRKKLQLVHMEV